MNKLIDWALPLLYLLAVACLLIFGGWQWRDWRADADMADLPAGINTPTYQKANPNDDPVIALSLTSDTQSVAQLYNLADSLLAQRLRQLPGVSQVDIAGASTPAPSVSPPSARRATRRSSANCSL